MNTLLVLFANDNKASIHQIETHANSGLSLWKHTFFQVFHRFKSLTRSSRVINKTKVAFIRITSLRKMFTVRHYVHMKFLYLKRHRTTNWNRKCIFVSSTETSISRTAGTLWQGKLGHDWLISNDLTMKTVGAKKSASSVCSIVVRTVTCSNTGTHTHTS